MSSRSQESEKEEKSIDQKLKKARELRANWARSVALCSWGLSNYDNLSVLRGKPVPAGVVLRGHVPNRCRTRWLTTGRARRTRRVNVLPTESPRCVAWLVEAGEERGRECAVGQTMRAALVRPSQASSDRSIHP
jgi:hypothetical protein